jgi:hypothetical protein
MHCKIEQYSIELAHTYNIDKKGFAIRKISKLKRVLSRPLYKQKHN